ncbi:MAG: cytochrome P450 [Myxococcota bacterium]|nr:cytochrome P450 [Myxococcota bacterium]
MSEASLDDDPGFDLLAQELYEGDPDACYAWLRANAPAYWDSTNELWGISRHADLVAIERDTVLFTSAQGSRPGIPPDPSMINTDDPRHMALRRIFGADITPRGVRRYEARVREIVDQLIDAVADRGACDLVQDLAIPLPVRVIIDLLGFDDERWRDYQQWSEITMIAGGGPRYLTEAVMQAAQEFWARAEETLHERREEPRDDWLSLMLAHADEGPGARDVTAMLSESLLILNGGSDTTRHVLAGGTHALLQHPEQLARLVAEPRAIPRAIEEMIRWVTPILNMRRTATRDTQLHGQKIREGDQLLLMYSSANRDAAVFEAPERFDTTRHPNPHIAFGIGTHFCLGANLARLELRLILEQMLRRLPGLRLASDQPPRVVATGFARGLAALPVAWDPA